MEKVIVIICLTMAVGVGSVDGMLLYSSGYNTFTDADPQGEEIFVENDAVLDFLSGNAGGLRVHQTATANIFGGSITYNLYTSENSVTNIYHVDLSILASAHDSIVNFYAYDVQFYSTGGLDGEGYMTGNFYQDDDLFNISFGSPNAVSHVNIVPEPTTLLLMSLGVMLMRKGK